MADERVVGARRVAARVGTPRASVPLRSRYRGDALDHAHDDGAVLGSLLALFYIAHGLGFNLFEDHGVSEKLCVGLVSLTAHRPGEQRQAEDVVRDPGR